MKDLKQLSAILDKELNNLALPGHPDSLYAPINYIMGLPAKRMRPLLVLIGYQLFDNNVSSAKIPSLLQFSKPNPFSSIGHTLSFIILFL